MKPIVLIVSAAEGNISLSAEELHKYVSEAYEQGYEDGKKTWSYSINNTPLTFKDVPTDSIHKVITTCNCADEKR